MFNLIIMGVAVLLFIVSVKLTWNNLSYVESKQKTIMVGVLIGITYIITTLLFKISVLGLNFGENQDIMSNSEQTLILLVTPMNSLFFIPYISSILNKWNNKIITKEQIKKRAIILSIIILIVLSVEGVYIRKTQNDTYIKVQELLKQQEENEKTENTLQNEEKNTTNTENTVQSEEKNTTNTENTVQSEEKNTTNTENIVQSEEKNTTNTENIVQNEEQNITNTENSVEFE